MFSVRQKREIADVIQKILRATNHPELPEGEIPFRLHVTGADAWSWTNIDNNEEVPSPAINPHNEAQDSGESLRIIVLSVAENGVRLLRDGDQWCAVLPDFKDLQNSPAGFGESQLSAITDLARRERSLVTVIGKDKP